MGILSSELSNKSMVALSRQLATSYGAGIPVLRSLELVRENVKDARSRQLLAEMHRDIRAGATLGQAARNQSRYLPKLFIELLSSGEVGGRLDVILKDLADYYEDRLAMRRSILQMMAYPILQLLAAWFIGSFALMLVQRMGGRNFSLERYFSFYLGFQASALVVFGVLAAVFIVLARMGVFKWIWGWIATYFWPLSPVTRKFAMARFFRSFSFLVGSGMPITQAIESSASVAANPYIERDLATAVPRVRTGVTLMEAFAPCKYFTSQAREMLRVGEESGQLEDAARKASEYQLQDAKHAVTLAARVGEVVIALAVAAVVGYVVISFYMNLYGSIDAQLN